MFKAVASPSGANVSIISVIKRISTKCAHTQRPRPHVPPRAGGAREAENTQHAWISIWHPHASGVAPSAPSQTESENPTAARACPSGLGVGGDCATEGGGVATRRALGLALTNLGPLTLRYTSYWTPPPSLRLRRPRAASCGAASCPPAPPRRRCSKLSRRARATRCTRRRRCRAGRATRATSR